MENKELKRVIQFGEGNFLRGFVDDFLYELKEKNLFNGDVVVVQPIKQGMCDVLEKQDCNYNLYLRGIENGQVVNEHKFIDIISHCINPYISFEEYLDLANDKNFRFIVSNTTESGIVVNEDDKFEDKPASSFPGKLTQLLYKRYENNLPGFIVLSCELIDNNGLELKKCVNKYIELWELEEGFKRWIDTENDFCSTLVDRIVTGYPKDEAELKKLEAEIGYKDLCLDTAEIFHQWVIEGNYESELPLQEAGFNVIWTDDVSPYKKRKVRILNGAHTSMVLGARLYGLSTVRECLEDETINKFLRKCIFKEIIPAIGGSDEDLKFGNAVIERFSNPFIEHQLLSIALNSVSKFDVRVLPTILEYREKFGYYPAGLSFSMAALIKFYKTNEANDSEEVMKFMAENSVEDILKNRDLWHSDLIELIPIVQKYYDMINENGIEKAFEYVIEEEVI
ncbi:tagaturonate reductase [Anaerosphaera aminiphila DSM 21120]|uniref:Tagaturonate reductase n=1 Tax=Anaerosphaera aminiphila DSM 21120 TaxID=1120995 RepID=A0A1M5U5L5_9FIRM|nr:tagaturonate reductase [Anaerosphaera aminiphila]SHH58307.1 tagaturonate reductase [Anaerosphaera aminiphila DSM 21120]